MRGQSEDSAEDLYENAPCGYLSALPDGTITKVNGTFLRWTGHSRDQLVGHSRFQDLLSAGGRIYHETHLAPLLRMQDAVHQIALEVICADGRRLPVLVNSALLRDSHGDPMLVRTTVFDATERKGYERELLRTRDRERDARERTEQLQRITALLADTLVPEQIGAAIIPELLRSSGAATAVLAVSDETDGQLQVITRSGMTDEPAERWLVQARRPEGPVAAALESDEPVFADDPPAGSGAVAVLPLQVNDRSQGILWLEFPSGRELTAPDRAFLGACAAQLGQALERAQLHESTALAARRSAFHARASRALDEVQGFAERAQRLVNLIVEHVGGLAWLELHDDEQLVTVAVADEQGTPRQELLSRPREARLSAHAAAAVQYALARGEPRVIVEPDRPDDAALPGSFVALPLRARGNVLGVLILARFDRERRFRKSDLTFLAELADRAGLALENARLYEQQRDVAHVLQQSLLAGTPPQDPRFQVATRYQSAIETLEVGGDWYDTFATGEHRIGVVVGDVVGRGIVAASAMGQLRSAVRALAGAGLGPAEVIDRLDVFVAQIETARWATVAFADVDLQGRQARFASAGHPPPVLAVPGQPARLFWGGRSPPLGVGAGDEGRSDATMLLPPGARLLLYTDGLVERRDEPIDVSIGRLVDDFDRRRDTPLSELLDALITAMQVGVAQHRDDVCVLCLQSDDPGSG